MPTNETKPTTAELQEYVAKYKAAVKDTVSKNDFFHSLARDPKWGPIMRWVESNSALKNADSDMLPVLKEYRNEQYQMAQRESKDVDYAATRLKAVDTEAEKRVNAAPTQEQAKAEAAKTTGRTTTPTTTNTSTSTDNVFGDDPTAFQPVFLNDRDIEDLARTGQFDLTPQAIASMFPSAQVQEAVASGGQPSLLDQLAPSQYRNSQFVNIGQGFAESTPNDMRLNQIADADLPDWEKKSLEQQLHQNTGPQAPKTQAEYEAGRQKIYDQYTTRSERELALAQYAQQWEAAKADQAGTGSLRDVISRPYKMTASEVAAAAVQLFKAGYLNVSNYDPTKPLSKQMNITSPFDPSFQKAWQSWVSDSMKDRSKSMMDILKINQDSFMPNLQNLADKIREAQAKAAPKIQLTDSASIRTASDTIAQDTIGRKMTDTEHAMLVGYIHNLEAQSQQALNDGATSIEGVDYQARLLEAIKANNPVESDATDVAHQYDTFSQLLAGPRAR